MALRRIRLLWRLWRIERTLARFRLDDYLWRMRIMRSVGWLHRLRWWRKAPLEPVGLRLRLCIEALGPIFVKFGQAVSVRRDLLPADIADELAQLQDRVPPFPAEQALAGIEKAFGRPAEAVFAAFDEVPLAAASIAQVHAARMQDGREVVVKILRPEVRAAIEQDLAVLFMLAELLDRHWSESARVHPVEVVREFEKTLFNELDLMREAANAAQLRRNFGQSEQLYVPEIFWDFCRSDVLTMERIRGIPISDMAALEAANVNIRRLAENGVDIFFTQVFEHNFFHADMHPGNIFVDATEPERPRYAAVDFGIVGTLSPADQHYLAENFLAFFRRDYYRVAKLHVDSGWVPADTRVDELESAIRAVCEPIFDKPLKDISFGVVLLRLFATAREFNMEVQPQLILLQKTLLAIEGLGRQLYPELDLWKTAFPVLETWVKRRRDPRQLVRRWLTAWPEISEDLMELPALIRARLRQSPPDFFTAAEPPPPPPRSAGLFAATAFLFAGVAWLAFAVEPAVLGWAAVAVGALRLGWGLLTD